MNFCLLFACLLLALGSSAAVAGVRCDGGVRISDVSVINPEDDSVVLLRQSSQFCVSKDAERRVGSRMGLKTADEKKLIPHDYNNIIPLNTTLSLVQKDDLDGKPDGDDGWYLYQHRKGEQEKLPWDRFEVAPPRSMAPRPGVVIAVGELRSEPKFGEHRIGVMTSYMSKVQDFSGLYGHPMTGAIDYFDVLKGQRRSVQLYRNHAFVVHTRDGSQMFNLQGAAITPILADIQLLQGGRDAVSPLMKTRHRDLPKTAFAPLIPGQSEDQLYLPIDQDGTLMRLPEGAVGVMWIPGLNSERDIYVSGWAIVFPKGDEVEVAIGSGSVVDVVRRAAALPRYAGLSLPPDKGTAYRLVLKLPESREWLSVGSTSLQVDDKSQRAAQAVTLWKQSEKEVLDRYMADRQKVIERNAEIVRLRAEEQRRLQEASARYHAQLETLRQRARSGSCDYDLRAALDRFDEETAREFLSRCGLNSQEDIGLASRVGVSAQKISAARVDFQRRNGELEAQRARNAGTAALLNAMKYRGPDSNWAEVRVYDRNGMYQGTRTMTGLQAEIIGAK